MAQLILHQDDRKRKKNPDTTIFSCLDPTTAFRNHNAAQSLKIKHSTDEKSIIPELPVLAISSIASISSAETSPTVIFDIPMDSQQHHIAGHNQNEVITGEQVWDKIPHFHL